MLPEGVATLELVRSDRVEEPISSRNLLLLPAELKQEIVWLVKLPKDLQRLCLAHRDLAFLL
jgi:hypothetical protein